MPERSTKRDLDALAVEVARDRSRLEVALRELRAARAATTDDDEHDPDGAPLSQQWSQLEGRRVALAERERALDELRAAAREGRDGRCIRCGRPIDPRRIAAFPFATRCIDCARLDG